MKLRKRKQQQSDNVVVPDKCRKSDFHERNDMEKDNSDDEFVKSPASNSGKKHSKSKKFARNSTHLVQDDTENAEANDNYALQDTKRKKLSMSKKGNRGSFEPKSKKSKSKQSQFEKELHEEPKYVIFWFHYSF